MTWTLTHVYTTTETNLFDMGKDSGIETPECERCGRRHETVYVVTDGTKTLTVGSTCCRTLTGRSISKGEAQDIISKQNRTTLAARILPAIETWTESQLDTFLRAAQSESLKARFTAQEIKTRAAHWMAEGIQKGYTAGTAYLQQFTPATY